MCAKEFAFLLITFSFGLGTIWVRGTVVMGMKGFGFDGVKAIWLIFVDLNSPTDAFILILFTIGL